MQEVADKNIPPAQVKAAVLEKAIHSYTGKTIKVEQAVLERLFDAMHCVRERKYRAGAAPERVVEHVAAAREILARDRVAVAKLVERLEMAHHRMDSAFSALQQTHAQ
jgi:hypothetical protein